MVTENKVSCERVSQRQEKGSEDQGRTGGGMYVEVDGWMVHGKYRESGVE